MALGSNTGSIHDRIKSMKLRANDIQHVHDLDAISADVSKVLPVVDAATPGIAALAIAGLPTDTSLSDIDGDKGTTVFIACSILADALSSLEKRVKALQESLMQRVIDHYINSGQQRCTRLGRTAYVANEEWPKVVDDDLIKALGPSPDDTRINDAKEQAKARLVEALAKDPTTAHLLKTAYNHQSLRSFILSECPEDELGVRQIPEHLEGKLGVTTKPMIRVTKG